MSRPELRSPFYYVGLLSFGVSLAAMMLMSNIASRAMEIGEPALVLSFPVGSGGPTSLVARTAAEQGLPRTTVLVLASSAIRHSAANYPAYQAIALVEPGRADALLRQAALWTRRDPNTLLAFYRNQIRRGDIAGALDTADALLRLQKLDNAIYPDLARHLGDEAFRAVFSDHMASAPGWRGRFFALVPVRVENGRWLVDIADRVAVRGTRLSRFDLAPLINGLMQLGKDSTRQSFALWQRRFGDANPLAWPDEAAEDAPLPFDWSIPTELRGSVYFEDRTLSFTLSTGDQPVIARKITALIPGSYRFAFASSQQTKVRWSVLCSNATSPIVVEDQQSFVLPFSCDRQVFELTALSQVGKIGTVSVRSLR